MTLCILLSGIDVLVMAKDNTTQSRTESLCRNGLALLFKSGQSGSSHWYEFDSSVCIHTIQIIIKNPQDI